MSITNPTKPVERRRTSPRTLGPQALFATAIVATFAVLAGAVTALPRDFVLPIASTLLLVTAVVAALTGWLRERGPDPGRVTYWDVAGALTLIGIGAAALMDPDQLARVFEGPHRDK